MLPVLVLLIALVLAAGAWWLVRSQPPASPIARLVRASAGAPTRSVEPRLSGGFAWSPYHQPDGSRPRNQATAEAVSVLAATQEERSAASQRAAALSSLLLGRSGRAVELLAPLTATGDAGLWSDLAAAHLEEALATGDPQPLGDALAAADAALRADTALPEALFNRALVLERYGLRDLAREAWERFVAVDPASRWAAEARHRIAALAPLAPFRDELANTYDALAEGGPVVRAFVRKYPQEARTWGETEILARWAATELERQHEAADKHLRIARRFGDEVAAYRGDQMLRAAVAAIDGAGKSARRSLARGHLAFRDAQKAYKENKASAARPLFARATAELTRGGSPVALLARYFLANTTYDAGQTAEALRMQEQLLAAAPIGFPAHRAQLEWVVGRAYGLDGRWGDSLALLATGAERFESLDERNYAATVREIRAEFYDRTGDSDNAWRERMSALRYLGRQLTPRLLVAISSMSRTALVGGHWQQAASFLDLELEVCKRVATPMRWTEMLLLRAQLRHKLGDDAGGRADLATARAEIVRLDDPALSSLLEEQAVVVDALLAANPTTAVQRLTLAIDSFEPRGRRVFEPEALLLRGRAYAALGDRPRAAADFEAGIAALEAGRESLPDGESRWGILSAVDDLFAEAIGLALAAGDVRAAFSYLERARARQLGDVLGARWSAASARAIPPDTVLIAFAVFEKRLVTFTVSRSGTQARQVEASRQSLEDAAARLTHALRRGDARAIRSTAAALHRLLIEPIATQIGGARRLVLIANPLLAGVPFAVLLDRQGRFLVERHALVTSPSAAVFLRLAERPGVAGGDETLLLVANPRRQDRGEAPLLLAEKEARAIAPLYRRATLLSGEAASLAAFASQAPRSTVIHFAGHAIADGGPRTALLLAPTSSDDGRADAEAIAKMPLSATRVVVLAACNTARGDNRGSEGTISVARAFLAAGVPSVIATLHPLADQEAARFFPRVHEYLRRGEPPADALRSAQLDWIRDPSGDVDTWVAVEVIGR